eukprot:COSAG02_NODE_81_length_39811_cov_51.728898_22_plen_62_part_00
MRVSFGCWVVVRLGMELLHLPDAVWAQQPTDGLAQQQCLSCLDPHHDCLSTVCTVPSPLNL